MARSGTATQDDITLVVKRVPGLITWTKKLESQLNEQKSLLATQATTIADLTSQVKSLEAQLKEQTAKKAEPDNQTVEEQPKTSRTKSRRSTKDETPTNQEEDNG